MLSGRCTRRPLQAPSGALRAFSSSGMDAFLEFEREMAMKRHQTQEKLLEYELSQQGAAKVVKPNRPAPRYNITFLDQEPTPEQSAQMRANDRTLYTVARNELISQPYRTKDGAWRSVRHIDLHVDATQHDNVGDNASNIAVFVPNDSALVDRMLRHLQVDPDIVFTIAPIVTSDEPSKTPRPFEHISSVRDALTWSLDLVSTPRSSLLRQLAAYATDDEEVTTLMAPQAAETLKASRPDQPTTLADVFDLFPSVRIDLASFLQLAPLNSPRYYTVSSSRRRWRDSVSITLGLRRQDGQPLPRCSSYLSALEAGRDRVRATFFQSSFVFPHRDRRPIMMISAGTGIAPFRAFLQDLEHELAENQSSQQQQQQHSRGAARISSTAADDPTPISSTPTKSVARSSTARSTNCTSRSLTVRITPKSTCKTP
ncbi:hypothetical protein PINS_up014259 [Pythium insidiosum]|nr:hypothetical protein PINS_up014259 [Pythium insidiosum]